MIDLRPRWMPGDTPLYPMELIHDKTWDPLFVKVPGALLEVHVADLRNSAGACALHVGAQLVSVSTGLQPTSGLQIPCRLSVSNIAQWTLIELPEGGYVVWEWEQAEELLRLRFVHLESLDEVLPGTDERTLT